MVDKELIDKFGKHIINAEVSFDQEQFCVIFSAFKEFYEAIEKRNQDFMMYYKGIENPCPTCGGLGTRAYGSTATWYGGIGGQMITQGICDKCWGSGDKDKTWTNLRVLRSILTKEQITKYSDITSKGI